MPMEKSNCSLLFEDAKPSFSVVFVIWDMQVGIWATWKKLLLMARGWREQPKN